jgi:hypothetical protein
VFRLETFGWLRKIIWRNTGFGNLRQIRVHIENYEPRYDPMVVPIQDLSPITNEKSRVPIPDSNPLAGTKRYYSASDYHAMYLSGELTPIAVAHAILPLIRRDTSPPGVHSTAWFSSRVDLILAAAEASTLRYKLQKPLGPLDGVPTAVKGISFQRDIGGLTNLVKMSMIWMAIPRALDLSMTTLLK